MDVEKAIEFLLQHHARFAAEMDILKDQVKHVSENLDRLEGVVDRLQSTVDRLQGTVDRLQNTVGALQTVVAAQQGQITQILTILEGVVQSQAALTQSQQHTDQRLNALIQVVDDLIRRDGGRR